MHQNRRTTPSSGLSATITPGKPEKGFLKAWEAYARKSAALFGLSANPMLHGERQSPDFFRMTGGSFSPCLMNFIDTEFTQCRVFFDVYRSPTKTWPR